MDFSGFASKHPVLEQFRHALPMFGGDVFIFNVAASIYMPRELRTEDFWKREVRDAALELRRFTLQEVDKILLECK